MSVSIQKEPAKSLVIAAFAAIYLIWGSTYLGILLAIKTIPPMLMAAARFSIAGLLLLAWGLIKKESLPPVSSILRIALSGLLMLFIGNGAVTWVEQYLPSGLAAIIVATVPLWFVVLDKRQWNFYFRNKQIIFGLCIGFAGVILLFAGKSAANLFNDKMRFISLLVLIAGTISWTIGSLYAKYQPMEGSTTMKVALQMLAAGLAFFVLAFATGEHHHFSIHKVAPTSLAALGYLILFGSLVGYLAYMWLLSVRPASLVGTYAYVNPVVAVFLGWLIAKEQISLQQGVGLTIIVLGLVIVNLSKEKALARDQTGAKTKPERAPAETDQLLKQDRG
ncbi:MAG TPA: EamA family transporter [Flavisolibacter sp.]|jgi:drug/metabolite transporter (DMT)-like permease|nr:EamA family transporter [Flavisolibacter sp.]